MSSLLYYVFLTYALKLNLQPNKNFKNLETRCLLFQFSNLRSHGWFKFSLSFQWCVVTYKMFSEEKLSQTGQKTANYWCKIFLLKHILRFEYKEKCLSKLSIKIFTKREARAWKAYAYQMLLSCWQLAIFLKIHVGQLCPLWSSFFRT